jgi:Domain of unknown function (DUF6458)
VTAGGFGGALFLIAVGAILRYAVTWEPSGIDLAVVGLILMIAGIAMLVLTLVFMFGRGGRPTPGPY